MSDPNPHSASELKLPSGPSARRRSVARNHDEWTKIDQAEQRRPVVAMTIVGLILVAGLALIVSSFVR